MRWKDVPAGYGWISIGLHWLTALFVVVMLFVGSSIRSETGVNDDKLRLHTGLAVIFYLALWFRVYWRFRMGHPGPLRRQQPLAFAIGKYLHGFLLIALGAMLISGPIMAWAGGFPIDVFGLFTVPSPIPVSPSAFRVAHQFHAGCASALAAGAALHLCGSAKHFFFDNDGSLDRILIAAADPAAPPSSEAARPSPVRDAGP
ncbi:MAG: hypothetical protein B7Y99_07420 [Caulobacterales bacterium 32-69-10]|nr:MAG: hypothetical protein B7Y99_07420 [Caulobacterales bacterium 32-69-10]